MACEDGSIKIMEDETMTNIREALELGLLALGVICALVAGLLACSMGLFLNSPDTVAGLLVWALGVTFVAMPACFGLSLAVSRA